MEIKPGALGTWGIVEEEVAESLLEKDMWVEIWRKQSHSVTCSLEIYLMQEMSKEVVLRWQRNRKGRSLSPPQSHEKNI